MPTFKAIETDQAPAPVGPYSQAIKAGDWIMVSGQVALDPHTGGFCNQDLKMETRQVLENLKAVLTAAGTRLDKVIKTTIYLTDLNDFETVNTIYAEYFSAPQPARACIEVSRLPKDARVEIDAIALSE